MAKKATGFIKLQIPAGQANPAPPVGPALGQKGVNIMEFCKQFNARTSQKELEGLIVPVVITVYSDRSFTFITKTPPASVLLKRAANLAKGSAVPNKTKVGTVTAKQVQEIAKLKLPDLNTTDLAAARQGVERHALEGGLLAVLDGAGHARQAAFDRMPSALRTTDSSVAMSTEACEPPRFAAASTAPSSRTISELSSASARSS